jgi:predicted ATPase/Tfp pilus assembly protein PilF
MADRELPAGNVSLLFTDIEGSTRLIEELGESRYVDALAEHRRLLRAAFSAHGGVEVDTQGDAFLYAFADPVEALAAAAQGQQALAPGPVQVRMALHTGELQLTGEGYAGRELHKAARIAASGHGGQVVVSAATRALIDGELTELGEHRLKDFDEPVPLFQLGDGRFPPLKTISNTNLPRPASSFVGRGRERDELLALLRNGSHLVTLTGPGGSGKTRLAVEVASELVPAFKAGVFWIGLSALRDPTLVTQTIAQTLGVKDGLAEHVSERELLLLLDNFEQVVKAAPELSQLLAACPNLRLLVTSRELLRISGEVEYPVPPLAEPEAVELFCERSRLEPEETIATLCRRLDELPLAVELAAARSRVLTPAQILDRLGQRLDLFRGGRDADPRQQTLRATIEWSHDLLTEEDKQLFARLAVFAGGCTLDAAADVCDAGLDVLQSLVDKSLLRHTSGRFWMLETIREFAAERLADRLEAGQVYERHARWYLILAKSAHGELRGVAGGEWLERLDAELENLRSAITWAWNHDKQLEVDLAGATWRFLYERGLLREALDCLRRALETAAEDPSLDESELLYGASNVALNLGDDAAAEVWAEKRLQLGRDRRDAAVIARSLVGLALVATERGNRDRARTLYRDAADAARSCGDTQSLAIVANNLGDLAVVERDAETAQMHYQRALELYRELRDVRGESGTLHGLALLLLNEGAPDEAAAHLNSALRLQGARGEKAQILVCLLGFADAASQRGETVRAARLLGAADALGEEMSYDAFSFFIGQHRTRIATVLDPNDAALAAVQSEGRALTLDEAVAYALEEHDQV